MDATDVHALTMALDDVVDHAEEAADELGRYGVEAPLEAAEALAEILHAATEQVESALTGFCSGWEISTPLSEIHRLEKRADVLVRDSVSSLFAERHRPDGGDPLEGHPRDARGRRRRLRDRRQRARGREPQARPKVDPGRSLTSACASWSSTDFHIAFTNRLQPRRSVLLVAEPERALSALRHLPLTQAAAVWAVQQHAGQRRETDGAEFVMHPIEVASLVDGEHYPDHVVAAAVLHDVLENTDETVEGLEERFGPEVAGLVEAVSDDPSVADEDERKDELRERVRRAGGYAAVVYAADKVSKVRELRTTLSAGVPREEVESKLRRHRESLLMLEAEMLGGRMVELLRVELDALDELPHPA